MKVQRLTAPLLLLLIAGAAWALTEQDLQDEADRLSGVLATLDAQIDACPGGTCGGAAQIVSDHDDAANDLAQLAGDRASLPGCSCVQVDADLADLEATLGVQDDTIGDWVQ